MKSPALGVCGSFFNFKPVCSRGLSPLMLLHFLHEHTQLDQELLPPRTFGTT
ncbi:MAG: hypothetical protein RBT45_05010 [Acholeplasmataceae bacterium]|nr:hypothetical protein [Acholeplasmataceae bacterium]